MIRRIVNIDEEKCTGCGKCAQACHEGAIAMIEGKARLIKDDYCDGLGDCLPACPAGAISFTEREAAEYDEAAVKEHLKKREAQKCPGTAAQLLKKLSSVKKPAPAVKESCGSELMQWPCQIKLMPLKAPYYDGAELLIAADCTAFACADIHSRFMRGRITVNGCPKLDGVDYSEKLGEILAENDIKSVTLLRMQVPCCGGMVLAAEKAIRASGKKLPLQVYTLNPRGDIIE